MSTQTPPVAPPLVFAKVLSFPSRASGDGGTGVDSDEDTELPEPLPEEVLAIRYADTPAFCYSVALSARWAYQRGLVVDYTRTDGTFKVANRLLDMIQLGEESLEEWPAFAFEVFALLYAAPKDVQPLQHPDLFGVTLWSYLESSEEWQELRSTCQGRRAIAIDSTTQVLRSLYYDILRLQDVPKDERAVQAPPPPPPPASQGAGPAPEEPGEDEELAENDVADEDDDEEEGSKGAKGAPVDFSAAQQRRASLGRKLARNTAANPMQQIFAWLAQILANATSMAQADQMLRDAMAGMAGGGGGGNSVGMAGGGAESVEELIDIELLNLLRKMPDLRGLLDLIGHMQRASNAPQVETPIRTEPTGIQPGQFVDDLLLSEHVLADAAPDLWLKRYLEGETLQTKRSGMEEAAGGDLIIVKDDSYSMQGEPWRWATSLSGALMLEALTMGRRCVVARYSDIRNYRDAVVIAPSDVKEAMKVLSLGPDGGTDTSLALRRAAQRLKAPLREPDIVLITDGGWPDLDDVTIQSLKGEDGRGRLFVLLLEPSRSSTVPGATQSWSIPQLDIATTTAVLKAVRNKAP